MKLLIDYLNQFYYCTAKRYYLVACLLFIITTSNSATLFAGGINMQSNIESVSLAQKTTEQLLAFPGADGWGKYTTGGRGGSVIYVTNLNDSGQGSLRAACDASGARTIVFKVSGTIELKSTLRIRNDNITIAGQTAPGNGITLKGRTVDIRADNVIIRYLRFRMGDFVEDDAFKSTEQKNIIIDHCTMSWGVDEAASFYRNENFTMQNCIIAESLYRSIHAKGDHGYGGIWGGKNASFIRNLIAHHTSRTPRFNGARYLPVIDDNTDFRNNVIYNWGFNNVYGGDPNETWGTKATINVVNNYYKPGPATNSGQVAYRVVEPSKNATFGYSRFHVDGNEVFNKPEVLADNWALGVQSVSAADKESIRSSEPFEHVISETLSASDAYEYVLANAGVRIPGLDVHELRVIEETKTGTATFGGAYKGIGTGIIDTPADVGGWPELFSAPAPIDTDNDGMSDEWETANGLDPNNPDDRNLDMLDEGYTNLEYYLNNIQAMTDFVRPPSNLVAELTNITEVKLTWTDNAENETGFRIERMTNGVFETIAILPANSTSYIDSNLSEETEYAYKVLAFSETETSVYSNTVTATTFASNSVPQPVSNPQPANSAVNVSTSTLLAWDSSLGAETYDIYFGETSPPPLVINQSENVYEAQIQAGRKYYWRVEAVNSNGSTNQNKIWNFTVREIITPQLVGHWTLDSYSNLLDSSPFENNGTAVNVGYAASVENAPVDRAIKFNGSSQYIEIPNSFEFDFEDDGFTIAFWLRHDANMTAETKPQPYIFKGSMSGDPNSHYYLKRWEVFSVPASNRFVFQLHDGNNSSQVEAPVSHFLNGSWVHVAAIRNSENSTISLYADGAFVASETDNTGDLSQYENLFFAHRPDDNTFCRGSLDDIRLYNYALSNQQLNELLGINSVNEQPFANHQLEVYPNPANNRFWVKLPSVFATEASLNILNTLGQTIHQQQLTSQQLIDGHELGVESFHAGSYIVFLNTKKSNYFARLMISR